MEGRGVTRRNERALYGEPQESGLCQMHSLNAYFGGRRFAPDDFRLLCEVYVRATGQPAGTSVVGGSAGFFGELGKVVVHEREPVIGPDGAPAREGDGSVKTRATRVSCQTVGAILHHAIARAGDPFDEAVAVSAAYESPGTRRTGSRTSVRPAGAWSRPRLDPARLAAQGIRAVFVFDPGHIWVWRYGSEGGRGGPGWHRIDSLRAGGAPQRGDPSGEWNGPYGIAVAVPRASYR